MRDAGNVNFFKGLSRTGAIGRILFCAMVITVMLVATFSFINASRWIDKPFAGFLINGRIYISDIGRYSWSGTKAGVKYPDRLLAANGKPVLSGKDLDEVVESVSIGSRVTYSIEKGGKTSEFAIPTMRFSLGDFLVVFGSHFLAGFIYISIAVAVFVLKPDKGVSWAYFLFGFFMSIYTLTSFDVQSTHSGFVRLYVFAAALIPATAVHLSMLFPEEKGFVRKNPKVKIVPYLLPLAIGLAMAVIYPEPIFVRLYSLTIFFMMISTLILLASIIHTYVKNPSVIARQRARVVLLGASLAFPVPAFLLVLGRLGLSIGNIQVLNNILLFPILVFPLSIAYAIARHNLFDVDVFIKRTVGYAIMTAVVGAAYLGLQVGLESVVLAPVFGSAARKITPVLFAFLVVFLFNPLNRRVQEVVDRMFFRKKSDYKETVTAVSDALSSVLDLDAIVRKIVHTVRTEMFIDRSGLVLAGAQGERLSAYFVGDDPSTAGEEIRSDALSADDPLMDLVRKKKKLVTKFDVAEDPRFADVRETCGKRFEELGASLAVPLVYQGEVKAVLAVGQKKSGHFFTREDIDLLQTLASQGAVAIENANLAGQMKKEETVRTNLSRYLSPQIVDQIVKNDVKVNLGGARKVVTVLFSDIRNFTAITETRPPDQLVAILNEYFTEMAQIIFDHQGSLDKYIGDAIVAVFGSLVPLENPAKNATAAAIQMMKRLPELNRRWEMYYGFYMNIGIGINTGEVFLGNIGSPERMEFTVIGDAVNVASRFSGLAKPGQILVTKESLAYLGTDFRVREHPPAEVKGKSGKMEVFEILN